MFPAGSVICVIRPEASRKNGTLCPDVLLIPVEVTVNVFPFRSCTDCNVPFAPIRYTRPYGSTYRYPVGWKKLPALLSAHWNMLPTFWSTPLQLSPVEVRLP